MQPDIDAIAALNQRDSEKLYKELVTIAIFECQVYGWSGASPYGFIDEGTALAAGNSPEDIASQVIEETIDGTRKWNQEKYPDIKNHLKWAIKSVANNLANNSANKTALVSNITTELGEDESSEEPALSDEENGLLGKVIEFDEVQSQEFLNAIIDEFDGDKILETVLDAVMSGLKPEEISKQLNLPISQTYQLTRKLVRKIKRVVQNGDKVTGGGYGERRKQ